jgi:hypothetical protein
MGLDVFLSRPQRGPMKIVSKLYMNMQFKDDKEFTEEVQNSSNSGTPLVQPAPTRAYKEFQREPRVAYIEYRV